MIFLFLNRTLFKRKFLNVDVDFQCYILQKEYKITQCKKGFSFLDHDVNGSFNKC